MLFGGSGAGSSSPFYNDAWTWDGMTWTQLSPGSGPPERYAFGMSYDPQAQALVLYGGLDLYDTVVLSDMWLLAPGAIGAVSRRFAIAVAGFGGAGVGHALSPAKGRPDEPCSCAIPRPGALPAACALRHRVITLVRFRHGNDWIKREPSYGCFKLYQVER